jgi:hypothetical protein
MDRLPVIKLVLVGRLYARGARADALRDVEWLITEVDRLRRIEDAALEWHRACPHETEDAVENLGDAIDFNPRPESGK